MTSQKKREDKNKRKDAARQSWLRFDITFDGMKDLYTVLYSNERKTGLGAYLHSQFGLVLSTKDDKESFVLLTGQQNKEEFAETQKAYRLAIDLLAQKIKGGGKINNAIIDEVLQDDAIYPVVENNNIVNKTERLQSRGDRNMNSSNFNAQSKATAGKPFAAKNKEQQQFYDMTKENICTIGIGVAGTGKTYVAIFSAFEALKEKKIGKIYLSRAAVSTQDLGFLPGSMEDKMHPFIRPMYDEAIKILGGGETGTEKLQSLMDKDIVEILPMKDLRGRNIDDAYVVLDEAQNCDEEDLKTMLTRVGTNARMVFTGDLDQIDLRPKSLSGLEKTMKILETMPTGYAHIYFDASLVVRSEFVKNYVTAYKEYEAKEEAALAKQFKRKAAPEKAGEQNNTPSSGKVVKKQRVKKENPAAK